MSEPLSARLRALRKQQGLTQDQLAQQLFVSRQTISHWENDRAQPDYETLQKLADVFHLSLGGLLGDDAPHEAAAPAEEMEAPVKRKRWPLWLAAALVVCGALCAALWPKAPAPLHPIEWFEQADAPVEGQPFVRMFTFQSPVPRRRTQDPNRYEWYPQVYFREEGGAKFFIDSLDIICFFDNGTYWQDHILGPDLSFASAAGAAIGAGSSRSLTLGQGGQNVALGMGLLLTGKDASGHALSFRHFIPFSPEYPK